MRAGRPWMLHAGHVVEHVAERVFRLEHGANVGPLLHVACYVAFFTLLIVPGAVVAWPLRAVLWLLITLLNYSLTIGVLHMHCHRKLFVSPAANRVLEILLCFPSLLTAAEMTVLHVHHHHHNDGPGDVTSTLGCERGWAAVGYWFSYGWKVKQFTLRSIYALRDRRPPLVQAAVLHHVRGRQRAVHRRGRRAHGLAAHAPAGDRTGADGSVNTVNNMLNLFIFNQGYHAVHHAHPGIHWTEIPEEDGLARCVGDAALPDAVVSPGSAADRRSRDDSARAQRRHRGRAPVAAQRRCMSFAPSASPGRSRSATSRPARGPRPPVTGADHLAPGSALRR